MRFTTTYPLVGHGPYDPALLTEDGMRRFCRTAEAAGFDGIGFTDHPAPTKKWRQHGGHDALDPFVALAFCGGVTERLSLIPNIAVLPYRHPLIVAKMVATLDTLTSGRFILDVATGYLRGEYRALGVDFEQRNDLFDEAIAVMKGVWTENPFSYEGEGFVAKDLEVSPRPARPPRIWIGGNSQRSRRRVATNGDGWNPFPAPRLLSQTAKTPPIETVEDLAAMLDELWGYVEGAGRDRSEIDVCFGTPAGGSVADDDFNADAQCEGLEQLARLGVTWASAGIPGHSIGAALEALERYGETVIRPLAGSEG